MYTEREKEVLGKYLSWYIVMRSDNEENEQNNLFVQLQKEKSNHKADKCFSFEFNGVYYAFFNKGEKIFMVDKMTAEIIDHYSDCTDDIVNELSDRYPMNEIRTKTEEIKQFI